MKRCSILLGIRNTVNKIPLNTYWNDWILRNCWWGVLIHCCWESTMVQTLWKTQFLTKLNIVLLYNLAVEILSIYPSDLKTYIHTKISMWMFRAALLIITKQWKQPRCPWMGEWINKLYILTLAIIFCDNKGISYQDI